MFYMFLGAVIGYVTNWLAIKMLFWPRAPVYVFGHRLPMTPGLFVRRRRDFARALGQLTEKEFVCADELYGAMKRAEDQGLVAEFLSEMGPIFTAAYRLYARKTDAESFRRDCRILAAKLCEGSVIADVICSKIESLPAARVEDMIMAVVRRELTAITWLGAVLGAAIGALKLVIGG